MNAIYTENVTGSATGFTSKHHSLAAQLVTKFCGILPARI